MIEIIVIDIDFNTFREISMGGRGMNAFYTETARLVILYKEFNGMLFRHRRRKIKDPQQEMVWQSINMRGCFKVDRVSNFGEDDWKEFFTQLYKQVSVIVEKQRRKK